MNWSLTLPDDPVFGVRLLVNVRFLMLDGQQRIDSGCPTSALDELATSSTPPSMPWGAGMWK